MDNTSFDIISGVRWKDKNSEKFSDVFEIDLSFTQLCNHLKSRKQNIFNRDIPYGSCLCKICENAVLMVEGISKTLKNDMKHVPINPHDTDDCNSFDSNDESCHA